MKRTVSLLAIGLSIATGCRKHSRDELSLQPYTNIPPGTIVIAQMRIRGNLDLEVITTNEYVLEKFEDGFVTLRGTYGLSFGYAGSMIKSIERKDLGK